MPYNETLPYSTKGHSLARVVMPDSSLGLSPSVPSPCTTNTPLDKKNTVLTAFSSPDTSMDVLRELISNAKESVYIEMYSFSHKEILELLLGAKKRHVDVRIILEHSHATEWERNYTSVVAALLDDGGIGVRWSPLSLNNSYIFQHSKFLVIDNTTTAIMSANFGRAGITETGYLGNREWGVVIEEHEVVYPFLQKFHLDWRNALAYSFHDEGAGGGDGADGGGVGGAGLLPGCPKRSVLPLVFREESFCFESGVVGIPVDDFKMFAWNPTMMVGGPRWGVAGRGAGGGAAGVGPWEKRENGEDVLDTEERDEEDVISLSPVFSPDSLEAILELIASARETIDMEYMFLDSSWNDSCPTNPVIPALLDASGRGVKIKLLLDSQPYYNEKTITILSSSNVSLAYFNNAFFNSLHNKGMIVDSRSVLVSSINAGHNSIMKNSEAGVVVRNEDVARFYQALFDFDWALSKKMNHGFVAPHPQIAPQPLITKSYPDPYAYDDTCEFIVITNQADEIVDISGWYLTELGRIVAFPDGSHLMPRQEVLVCRDPETLILENDLYPDFYYLENASRVTENTTSTASTSTIPSSKNTALPSPGTAPGCTTNGTASPDSTAPGGSIFGRQMLFSPLSPGPDQNKRFHGFLSGSFGELRLNNFKEELFLLSHEFEIMDVLCYRNSESWSSWESRYVGAGFDGTYAPAPSEGTLLVRGQEPGKESYMDTDTADDWTGPRIYKIGQSNFPARSVSFHGEVTAFTFPEAGVGVIITDLLKAKTSVYINAYQFTHPAFLPPLLELRKQGVDVRILLEGFPMGPIPDEEKFIMNELHNAGAVIGFMVNNLSQNIHDRYLFDHAKYVVIDNSTAIVLTENLKPSGLPSDPGKVPGNRGWGVSIHNRNVASFFARTFFADFDPLMNDIFLFSPSHPEYGAPPRNFTFEEGGEGAGYKNVMSDDRGMSLLGDFQVSCFLGPDNLALEDDPILALIRSARTSINVELLSCKPTWDRYGRELPNLYLEELFKKAKEGVTVKLLLDTTYTNLSGTPDNYDCFLFVRERITQENLQKYFKIKLYCGAEFIKIHNKGVVVDGEKVLVSSVNWGPGGVLENREVGVIIHNHNISTFFNDSFTYDWSHSSRLQKGEVTTNNEFRGRLIFSVSILAIVCLCWCVMKKKRV